MATEAVKSYLVDRLLRPVLSQYVRDGAIDGHLFEIETGRILLQDVDLRTDSPLIDSLDLPVVIKRAVARRIEIQLHWGDLLGKPLLVSIDGVFLVAETGKEPTIDAYLDRQLSASTKDISASEAEAKDREAQSKARPPVPSVSSGAPVPEPAKGYHWLVTSAASRIARAVRIAVTNIHVRLEAGQGAKPCALGLTLARCAIEDIDGAASTVNSAAHADAGIETGAASFICKRVSVEGLSLYLDSGLSAVGSDRSAPAYGAPTAAACSVDSAAGVLDYYRVMQALIPGSSPVLPVGAASALSPSTQHQFLLSPLSLEMDAVVNDQGRPPPGELERLIREALPDGGSAWEEALVTVLPSQPPPGARSSDTSRAAAMAGTSAAVSAAVAEYSRFLADPTGFLCMLWYRHHVKAGKGAQAPEPASALASAGPRVQLGAGVELEGKPSREPGTGTAAPAVTFTPSRASRESRAEAPAGPAEGLLPSPGDLPRLATHPVSQPSASVSADGPVVGWMRRMGVASAPVTALAREFEAAALSARPPLLDAALRLPAVSLRVTDVQLRHAMEVTGQVGAYYAPQLPGDLRTAEDGARLLQELGIVPQPPAAGEGAADARQWGDLSETYRRMWRESLVHAAVGDAAGTEPRSQVFKARQIALERYWLGRGQALLLAQLRAQEEAAYQREQAASAGMMSRVVGFITGRSKAPEQRSRALEELRRSLGLPASPSSGQAHPPAATPGSVGYATAGPCARVGGRDYAFLPFIRAHVSLASGVVALVRRGVQHQRAWVAAAASSPLPAPARSAAASNASGGSDGSGCAFSSALPTGFGPPSVAPSTSSSGYEGLAGKFAPAPAPGWERDALLCTLQWADLAVGAEVWCPELVAQDARRVEGERAVREPATGAADQGIASASVALPPAEAVPGMGLRAHVSLRELWAIDTVTMPGRRFFLIKRTGDTEAVAPMVAVATGGGIQPQTAAGVSPLTSPASLVLPREAMVQAAAQGQLQLLAAVQAEEGTAGQEGVSSQGATTAESGHTSGTDASAGYLSTTTASSTGESPPLQQHEYHYPSPPAARPPLVDLRVQYGLFAPNSVVLSGDIQRLDITGSMAPVPPLLAFFAAPAMTATASTAPQTDFVLQAVADAVAASAPAADVAGAVSAAVLSLPSISARLSIAAPRLIVPADPTVDRTLCMVLHLGDLTLASTEAEERGEHAGAAGS